MKRGTPVATRHPQGHDVAKILPACHNLTPDADSKEGPGPLSSVPGFRRVLLDEGTEAPFVPHQGFFDMVPLRSRGGPDRTLVFSRSPSLGRLQGGQDSLGRGPTQDKGAGSGRPR
jgi:hypothetical protein